MAEKLTKLSDDSEQDNLGSVIPSDSSSFNLGHGDSIGTGAEFLLS